MAKSNKPFAVIATLTNLIDLYWDDPVAFAEDILNFYPDGWQVDVLNDLAHHPRVAVRSGQGVGKTAIEAVAVLWFICCRPNSRVVCTAPTRQQLQDVLWAEVKKRIDKSKVKPLLVYTDTRLYVKGRKSTWYATMKTATSPDNMQGYHEEYMLFIADEGSGIKDNIMEAILGTLSGAENKLFMCGNPTRNSGTFFDAFHRDRESYKTHKVSSVDSPRTNKETIDMLKRKYGEGSNVYRVRVLGEFPEREPDVFIPLEWIERAVMTDIARYENGDWVYEGPLHIGADIAYMGDDETVLYVRIGGHVFEPVVLHKSDTTQTAAQIIKLARQYMERYGKTKVSIKVDMGAMGPGVFDQVVRGCEGLSGQWSIVPVYFGGAGNSEYHDTASVMWGVARDMLEANELHLPNDERTIGQLSTRKFSVTVPKGLIRIEPKLEYKKRHPEEGSPDRADSLILCLYEGGIDGAQIRAASEVQSTQRRRPSTAGLRNTRF
ncbi:DEAD/DEAH box helicase family protein [Alicyclobacillus acidoterrestris]|uniref:DEAD/DEAH box helicase family protein n=1 Tax=Alicyclobacillus acidoterrestris TaxID=1450 RepID=UPI003F53C6C2